VLAQPLRDREAIRGMAIHAHRERLRAAQHEPGVERSGHATHGVLQEGETLAEWCVVPHDRSADDIGVSADVLGRRVQCQIGAVRKRILEIRAREGVVDDREGLAFVRDLGERPDVEHLQQRVGGRLDPHQARVLAHRFSHAGEPAHVDRGHRDAELIEHADEEPVRPTVHVVAHHDVIARLQKMRDGVGGRHAGAERQAPPPVLQRSETGLERRPGRIPGPRVLVALVLPHRNLREGRGLEDRHRYGAGEALGLLARVYRKRVEARFTGASGHAASMRGMD